MKRTLRDAFDRWKDALIDQDKQITKTARHLMRLSQRKKRRPKPTLLKSRPRGCLSFEREPTLLKLP